MSSLLLFMDEILVSNLSSKYEYLLDIIPAVLSKQLHLALICLNIPGCQRRTIAGSPMSVLELLVIMVCST